MKFEKGKTYDFKWKEDKHPVSYTFMEQLEDKLLFHKKVPTLMIPEALLGYIESGEVIIKENTSYEKLIPESEIKGRTKFIINKNKRCCLCQGREIIEIIGDKKTTNLTPSPNGLFKCKNQNECRQNIDAENTVLTFSNDKIDIKKFKEEIFSISKK